MRLRLIPRNETFFDLFEELVNKVHEGAADLLDLMKNFTDVDRKAARILEVEHEADDLTHALITRLNSTFITPFDREDIHRLATSLDDVLDHVEAATEYIQLLNITEPLEQMVSLSETLATAAKVSAEAFPKLRRMKGLEEYWVEIDRLEDEGDHLYRRTIADLFSGKYEALEVLRWKDIIEEIENGIDKLEDVANTIEGIVLKQA